MIGGKDEPAFYVQCVGQIESAQFSHDNLYCRYSFYFGQDWKISSGLDTGLSQTARKNSQLTDGIVWNFPIDVTFKATNVFGWPRIAISVYGIDDFGRDVVRGYGSALIPLVAGQHTIDIHTYTPLATSAFNQFVSWLMGNPPEFFDSKFTAQSEGREVTRVQHAGVVRIKVAVLTKGLKEAGYAFETERS